MCISKHTPLKIFLKYSVCHNLPHVFGSALASRAFNHFNASTNISSIQDKNEQYQIISDTIFFTQRRGYSDLCTTDVVTFVTILISELYDLEFILKCLICQHLGHPHQWFFSHMGWHTLLVHVVFVSFAPLGQWLLRHSMIYLFLFHHGLYYHLIFYNDIIGLVFRWWTGCPPRPSFPPPQ